MKSIPALIGLCVAVVVASAIAAFAITGMTSPNASEITGLRTGLPSGDPGPSFESTPLIEERESDMEANQEASGSGEKKAGQPASAEDGASLNKATPVKTTTKTKTTTTSKAKPESSGSSPAPSGSGSSGSGSTSGGSGSGSSDSGSGSGAGSSGSGSGGNDHETVRPKTSEPSKSGASGSSTSGGEAPSNSK